MQLPKGKTLGNCGICFFIANYLFGTAQTVILFGTSLYRRADCVATIHRSLKYTVGKTIPKGIIN